MIRTLFTICMVSLLPLLGACQTTGLRSIGTEEVPHPTAQEIYLEKEDARIFANTEWVGVWRSTKYPNTGSTKAVAHFHPLPAEGLYDLGQVLSEFIYHNPPNIYNDTDGGTFTRWPKHAGYEMGFIANGKLRIYGDKTSMSVREVGPGCLVLVYNTPTKDGYDFSARFERCDAVRFAGIFDRLNAIATVPTKGAVGAKQ